MIGAGLVAKAPPDGYTLLAAYVTEIAIVPGLYPNASYDPVKDFDPISVTALTPMILVVNPSLPARNVQELINLAKAKPGSLLFASSGIGVANHFAGETLKIQAGLDIVHVPYKGGAPAIADLAMCR